MSFPDPGGPPGGTSDLDLYRHTQSGALMRSVFGGGAVLAVVIAAVTALSSPSAAIIATIVATALLVCLFLFHELTVTVSPQEISVRLGVGLIRKRFSVAEVQGAAAVRNRWYYGWGVRLTPHGWLYSVSGLDAVEIQLGSGRKYRVGTDEPDRLVAAIESVSGGSEQ